MDYIPLPRSGRLWKSKADFFRPFRSAAATAELAPAAGGESITSLYDPTLHHTDPLEPDLKDLNHSLAALVALFPDVEPDVFREMLASISAESRVQVVAEHLLKKKAKWVRGRYRAAHQSRPRDRGKGTVVQVGYGKAHLAAEDMFRSEEYKKAVKQVLYHEFKTLSHSTIKGVMAERNYSYTLARPILQQLAMKSWRFSIPYFWSSSRRSAPTPASEHPNVIWRADSTIGVGQQTPALKRTGSAQLDHELYTLFIEAEITKQKSDCLAADFSFASQINEAEAKAAQALFDCECCYSSVPFEQLSTCDTGCHQLCFDCLRRSINEALYGQGFARTADLEKSTVRCFAPTVQECHGAIPAGIVRRALLENGRTSREDMWNDFQHRIATEALTKSRVRLHRCPFCTYAEVDEPPKPRLRSLRDIWRHAVVLRSSAAVQIMILSLIAALLIFTIPLLLLASMFYLLASLYPPTFAHVLHPSLARVHTARRGLKFYCRNSSCLRTTCLRCTSPWRDPHTCFESERTSLRTALENTATAAIKRTCPRCLLSFVKSSGCNKLVCNCGYTMCYICRSEITSQEGYSHFCQHFRPNGGRCGMCERCDLYGDEDEELAVSKAVEGMEREWREREEGSVGEKAGDERVRGAMVEMLVGRVRKARWWEGVVDAIVEAVVVDVA